MAKPLHHGDVVLVPFPFADLSGRKVRPAVIVSTDPQGPELILAFITSVLTNRSCAARRSSCSDPIWNSQSPA